MIKTSVAMASYSSDSESELSEVFEKAASHLQSIVGNLDADKLLFLYARFKQAKEGPCNIPKPGFFNFQAKQKWESWKSLGSMSSVQAMDEYVAEISRVDPEWRNEERSKPKSNSGGLGISVSTLRRVGEENLEDDEKTLLDWVRENNAEKVLNIVASGKVDVNAVDENGMTALHWASDRGHAKIVDILISHGADVNKQENMKQTPLHYACTCSHIDCVKILVASGADFSIVDEDGLLAVDGATDPEISALVTR